MSIFLINDRHDCHDFRFSGCVGVALKAGKENKDLCVNRDGLASPVSVAPHTMFSDIKAVSPTLISPSTSSIASGPLFAADGSSSFSMRPFHEEIEARLDRIFDALTNRNPTIRIPSVDELAELVKNCELPRISFVALDSFPPDASHDVVKTRLPQIIEILQHSDSGARASGANVLTYLAKECRSYGCLQNRLFTHVLRAAAFHVDIKPAVPYIMELLKDKDWTVRSSSRYALANLAEQCEW